MYVCFTKRRFLWAVRSSQFNSTGPCVRCKLARSGFHNPPQSLWATSKLPGRVARSDKTAETTVILILFSFVSPITLSFQCHNHPHCCPPATVLEFFWYVCVCMYKYVCALGLKESKKASEFHLTGTVQRQQAQLIGGVWLSEDFTAVSAYRWSVWWHPGP